MLDQILWVKLRQEKNWKRHVQSSSLEPTSYVLAGPRLWRQQSNVDVISLTKLWLNLHPKKLNFEQQISPKDLHLELKKWTQKNKFVPKTLHFNPKQSILKKKQLKNKPASILGTAVYSNFVLE